jgi:hypothetical protein
MADESLRGAYCANCRYAFAEGQSATPMPDVRQRLSRHVYSSARASIGATTTSSAVRREKHRRRGQKPALEIVHGVELHRDSGELREVDRVVDRVNNRYSERVTASDGTVLVDQSHPLTEHQGHGAAQAPGG